MVDLVRIRSIKKYNILFSSESQDFKALFQWRKSAWNVRLLPWRDHCTQGLCILIRTVKEHYSEVHYIAASGFDTGTEKRVGSFSVCLENYIKKYGQPADFFRFFYKESYWWRKHWHFPSTIDALDCTHIHIMNPQVHSNEYVNRKNFNSNMQDRYPLVSIKS